MLAVLVTGGAPGLRSGLAGASARAYSGPPAPTVGRLLTGRAIDPLLALGVAVAAAGYLAGVRALRRRGDGWSGGRSTAFGAGLLVIAWATLGGLGVYDTTLFSAHMAQHMLLNMVAPPLLALGAPVTLALRTLPRRGRGWLLAALHSRLARVVTFPPLVFVLFIGSTFVLYFSSLYAESLRHPLVHDLVHVHFLVVGCLFFWPLLSPDPTPGRTGHAGRMLITVAALPVHAFLGITLLSTTAVLGGGWYEALHKPWGGSLLGDQHTGAGILWASGELIGLGLTMTMLGQWMRADERQARRDDRQLDRLDARAAAVVRTQRAAARSAKAEQEDAELAAYNARLAALARAPR